MATQTKSPGTVADDATVGTVAWVNPDNAKVDDANDAGCTLSSGGSISHYLKATNFGFTIPTNATINGIVMEIKRYREVATVVDREIKIVKSDGTIGSTNKSAGASWPLIESSYTSFGANSDTWGETWTPADINDTDFGVVINANTVGSPSWIGVNHIRITVDYTEQTYPPTPYSFLPE